MTAAKAPRVSTAGQAAAKRPAAKRPAAQKSAPAQAARSPAAKPATAATVALSVKPVKAAKPAKVLKAIKPTKVAGVAKVAKVAKVSKPVKQRQKPVRDSFTMPEADFALIAALKGRLLSAQRETKKSELLRAGLHALAALDTAALLAALGALAPVKVGRPKSGH